MPDHSPISVDPKPPEPQTFHPGQKVEVLCSRPGCEDVKIPAILGEEQPAIRICFQNETRIGRFPWQPNAPMKAFKLQNTITCPKCGAIYKSVVIAWLEAQAQPLLCAA